MLISSKSIFGNVPFFPEPLMDNSASKSVGVATKIFLDASSISTPTSAILSKAA